MKTYITAKTFEAAAASFPELAPQRTTDGKLAIAGYDPEAVWKDLNEIGFNQSKVLGFLAFPLDGRFIYYETATKLLNRPRPEYGANREDNEFLLTVPEPRKDSETRPIFATTLANLHVHERGSVVFPRETRGEGLLSDRDANLPEPTWRVLRDHFRLKGERRDKPARAPSSLFCMHQATKPSIRVPCQPTGLMYQYQRTYSYLSGLWLLANR